MQSSTKKEKRIVASFFPNLWAAVLLLFVLIALLIILPTNSATMTRLFEKHSNPKVHGISSEYYPILAETITRYLGGTIPSMDISLPVHSISQQIFNQKELLHMADIAALINLGKQVLAASGAFLLVVLFFYLIRQKTFLLTKALKNTCIIFLCFILVLALWALIDFDSLFIVFHKLLFTNELWLLDAARDRLIQLMPLPFFIEYGQKLLISYVFILLLLFVLSLVLNRVFSPSKE